VTIVNNRKQIKQPCGIDESVALQDFRDGERIETDREVADATMTPDWSNSRMLLVYSVVNLVSFVAAAEFTVGKGRFGPHLSFPRKRESMSRKGSWIPAFAGMTEQGSFSTVSFAGMTDWLD
jgi:hypothetical protein